MTTDACDLARQRIQTDMVAAAARITTREQVDNDEV